MAELNTRRLAAIMFCDIAGYSAIMQRNEQEGRKTAKRYREVLEFNVRKYGGEIWQHYGDGSLSVFASAVESVRCAKAIQLTLQEEPKVPLRLGIHVGDIIKDGADIYGNGINIASRVESLGVPGSVLMTERLVFDIKSHPEFKVARVGKFAFKNIDKPMEVFALQETGLIVPDPKVLKGKATLLPDKNISARLNNVRPFYIGVGLVFVLLLAIGYGVINQWQEKQWALEVALPQIKDHLESLTYGEPNVGFGIAAWDAFEIAKKAQDIIPDNEELQNLWGQFSQALKLSSLPQGAKVFARPSSRVDSSWQFMGLTPLDNTLFPTTNISIRIEKEGYEKVEDLISLKGGPFDRNYILDEKGIFPENMILVRPRGSNNPLDSFLIDRYEVTNRDFKKFVQDGGYLTPKFWKHSFVHGGKTLRWEEAMQYMVDQKTNRPGPSTWIAGDYPEGKGNHPVSGISWYEAAAYAEYVNKQLPSIAHFRALIPYDALNEVTPISNFNQKGTMEVGASKVQGPWGIYDLFGNVGEWYYNDFGETKKLILGGGWNDQNYIATVSNNAKVPFDRSSSNGFRCIKLFDSINKYHRQYNGIKPDSRRDYYQEEPVSNEIYEVYLNQFVYDQINLEPEILYRQTHEHWIKEKVNISVPYEEGSLTLYVFIPKFGNAPFQTVIFFPHLGAQNFESSEESLLIKTNDFLVKNGRVVVYPIFKGTYERKFPASRQCNDRRVCDKEDKILIAKDLMISIDYLRTRQDVDIQKMAFMGMSWGGTLGGYLLAVEPRLKLGILKMAGFWNFKPFPEVDPLNYHPRVKVPILMLTGEFDPYFPYQSSQKPFFDYLGTAPADKKWLTYQDGHSLPRTETIKETLNFLDQHFGVISGFKNPTD